MKATYVLFTSLFFAVILLTTSCDDKKSDKKSVDGGSNGQEKAINEFDKFSTKFKKLVKTDTAIFRGVKFGTPVDSVKKFEGGSSPLETGENFISYSIPFNIKEEADVSYFFAEDNTINKIETDIYPENIESQTSIFNEFETFFTQKYGAPIIVGEVEKAWKSNDNKYLIEMKKTGNVKVHDIKIVYSLSAGKRSV